MRNPLSLFLAWTLLWSQLGATIFTPTNASEFQTALTDSIGGDEIHLAAGTTYTGNFTLPSGKASVVTIRTTSMTWSTVGQRVSPSDASNMAKVQSGNTSPALFLGDDADNWLIQGIEVAGVANAFHTINVIQIGDLDNAVSLAVLPDNVVVDRCLVRGDATHGGRRGVLVMGSNITVKNNYIDNFFSTGTDTQAIGIFEGTGPTLIENNFGEGAGENIFMASASTLIDSEFPENITIRRNYFKKRAEWEPPATSIVLKNLLEMKSSKHVLIEANIFENNWIAGQNGYGILFTCRDENGDNECEIIDTTFRNNKIINSVHGFNVLGQDDALMPPIGTVTGLTITNNWISTTVGNAFLFHSAIAGLTVSQNTIPDVGGAAAIMAFPASDTLLFQNNIVGRGSFGIAASGETEGTISLDAIWSTYTFDGNVLYPPPCCGQGYPSGNALAANEAAVNFVNKAGGNVRLTPASTYSGFGIGGVDPGINQDNLDAALIGVLTGAPEGGFSVSKTVGGGTTIGGGVTR